MATVQKTRKPKTNSFTSILDQVLNKYNLSAKSNSLQLHAHADELNLAVPKNNTDEAIVAASSHVSQFHRELAEARIGSEQIYIYAKLPEVTRASNEIQKRQLAEGLRRIQNINTTKIPTMQDLADYKPGYSWYCIGYIKNKGEAKNNPEPQQFLSMEKNPECAKELLTWIQDAITTRKLCNSVYSINKKHSIGVFSKILKSYDITAKRLRKIGSKHAFRIHSSQNPTSQHLEFLSRVAIRHKMDHHNSEMYYAKGVSRLVHYNPTLPLQPALQ
ncbi:638_t:CDS:2 [Cetraspora pellucida]|uniref:638_t:CDS:1 n=1 Tax=Cetraspora pellucida TaxID=1433469 RepID=A0A9N8VPC1_9GLOM|nr:638_t:CDS:2 [Cetraspora pellucida]